MGCVMKRRKIITYNPKLKEVARKLRNNSTLSEILFWRKLKGKQMQGFDFHRQKPLDNFIVDFFCNELMWLLKSMVLATKKNMKPMRRDRKDWNLWELIF